VIVDLQPSAGSAITVEAEQTGITKAPIRTEVISRSDLNKAACCSLAESFEKNPSVEVSFSDAVSGAKQIQLLGLRGIYTQFLVEAVPLIRGVEMPFALDHVPGPFMESISISKGSSTVTNGYESVTGQINICMHNPRTAPSLYVNAYANTMQRYELNLYGAQQVTDELSTMTMVHGRMMDMAMDNNGDGFADVPTFRQINAVHRWNFNNDEIEWQVFVRGLRDRYQSGQSVLGHHEDVHVHPDSTLRGSYDITTDISRLDGFVKFGLLNPIEDMEGSGFSLVLSGATHDQTSTFGIRNAGSNQQTLQLRGVAALPFSDEFKLVTGFSYLLDNIDESVLTNGFSRKERVPGVYGEVTLQPSTSLTALIGMRYDHHNMYGGRFVPRAHLKWSISDVVSFRASAGRGWRVPNVVAENLSSYINSRRMVFDPSFRPEDAWNAGASITANLEVGGRPLTLDAEFYHTSFTNQLVVDFDRSLSEVHIGNLTGISYASNLMAQVQYSPVPRLDLLLAGRWVDIIAPFNGIEQQKPMTSRMRILSTVSFSTSDNLWQADLTVAWNGSGRLPVITGSSDPSYASGEFPSWWRINGQLTRRVGNYDFYVGLENATNFIQQTPVLGADNPFAPSFDASLTWGSMDPRMVYVGVRMNY
jgi:outer membrane cobalamin receptor